MSKTIEDIRERARECARAAASADLANVRDRYLRSQKAFEAMADRTERVEAERAQRIATAEAAREERQELEQPQVPM